MQYFLNHETAFEELGGWPPDFHDSLITEIKLNIGEDDAPRYMDVVLRLFHTVEYELVLRFNDLLIVEFEGFDKLNSLDSIRVQKENPRRGWPKGYFSVEFMCTYGMYLKLECYSLEVRSIRKVAGQ